MSTPEGSSNNISLLPEAIPLEHFAVKFYGRVALQYWHNPDLTELHEAVMPVAESLTPEELFAIADLVDEDTSPIIEEEYGHYLSLWSQPKRKELMPDNTVRAIVGDHTNILERLRKINKEHGGYDNDILEGAIYAAAYQFKGQEFAKELMGLLERESLRRLNAMERKANEPNLRLL